MIAGRAAALRWATLMLSLIASVGTAAPALGATPRTSLTDVEDSVMCVSCREPLALAQSPQAYSERNFIGMLIGQGLTKPQILQALVGQYGTAVLAKPPARGFNLVVYVLPPALLLGGIITLSLLLPRWRRRTREYEARAGPQGLAPSITPADAQRLEQDLARFD